MFLAETFNRVVRVSKIPDCCNCMKALAEQRREGSTHPFLLWERLHQPCKAQPLGNWFSLVLQLTEQLVLSFCHLNNTCLIPNGLLVLIIIQSSTSAVLQGILIYDNEEGKQTNILIGSTWFKVNYLHSGDIQGDTVLSVHSHKQGRS